MPIKIGIDVSRTLSGGGISHIVGIIENGNPEKFDISEVHVWGKTSILDKIPDRKWCIKHTSHLIERNLFLSLFWQYFLLKKELRKYGCSALLSTAAGTIRVINPSIVMSRDMLPFELSEINRYKKFSILWLRLFLLRFIQLNSLKKATIALFLTNYAYQIINQWAKNQIKDFVIIPHGVSYNFLKNPHMPLFPLQGQVIKCVYVSNTAMYKHQWNVLQAIYDLRNKNYNIEITFIGGGKGPAQRKFNDARNRFDRQSLFSKQLPFVDHKELPSLITQHHIFIFASTCENMPNTLLEGMALGMPIVSSNRGPMPEILSDGGLYFDPEDVNSLVTAICTLLSDETLYYKLSQRAREIAQNFTWSKCADSTFYFLKQISLNR